MWSIAQAGYGVAVNGGHMAAAKELIDSLAKLCYNSVNFGTYWAAGHVVRTPIRVKGGCTQVVFDAFISHATEDNPFAEGLAAELTNKHGMEVWIDTERLGGGHSLRGGIDSGLYKSRAGAGVLLITPHYIEQGRFWINNEIDGLFAIDNMLIIPIRLGVTKEMVTEFSPMLSGKIWLDGTKGIGYVAEEIAKRIRQHRQGSFHARDYEVGQRFTPLPEPVGAVLKIEVPIRAVLQFEVPIKAVLKVDAK